MLLPVLHDKGLVPSMGLLTMIEGIANLRGSSRRYEKLRRCSAAYSAVAAEATYAPSFFRSASKRRYKAVRDYPEVIQDDQPP
jgi:hypothetical protein